MPDEPSNVVKKVARWFLTWITVIASVATVVGLWFQTRDGAPRIDALLEGRERLTAPSIESKLKVSYNFEGKEVKDLWKVRIIMRHTKGQTVIGAGPKQNIIGSYLPIKIDAPCEILALNIEENQPKVIVDKISLNEIALKFDQWRKDERLILVLYLEVTSEGVISPQNFSSGRTIVDGEVVYGLPEDTSVRTRKQLIDFLPPSIALSARVFLSLLSVGLIIGGFAVFASTLKEAKEKRRKWMWSQVFRIKALEHFKAHVPESAFDLLKDERFIVSRNTFQKITGKSEDEVWASFDGVRPAVLSELNPGASEPKFEVIGAVFGSTFLIAIGILIAAASWTT